MFIRKSLSRSVCRESHFSKLNPKKIHVSKKYITLCTRCVPWFLQALHCGWKIFFRLHFNRLTSCHCRWLTRRQQVVSKKLDQHLQISYGLYPYERLDHVSEPYLQKLTISAFHCGSCFCHKEWISSIGSSTTSEANLDRHFGHASGRMKRRVIIYFVFHHHTPFNLSFLTECTRICSHDDSDM